MKIVFSIMGKGGVGKSTLSLKAAEYLINKGKEVICVDTDGVNKTLSRYKQLNAQDRNVLDDETGEKADLQKIDDLFSELLEKQEEYKDKYVIIDIGASSFTPVRSYLLENEIHNMGLDITVIIPLVGSESKEATFLGANDILTDFGNNIKYLIVENQRDGKVNFSGSKLEKSFLQEDSYIGSVVYSAVDQDSLLGKDFKTAVEKNVLYQDIDTSKDLKIMSRQRIKIFYNKFFKQLDDLKAFA